MSAENYAQFLENLGHRVVRTKSSWWASGAGRTFGQFPYHHQILPSRDETDELLGLTGTAARYCCPVEAGSKSHMYVMDDPGYSLDTLSSNTRSKTRRGLKRCEVRRLNFDELESAGAFDICAETISRQHSRSLPKNHTSNWQRYATAAQSCNVMETWGAFLEGKLVAFLVAGRIENCMNIFIARSSSAARSAYPNNALMYEFLHQAIRQPGIDLVSFGWQSIRAEMDSLEQFKSSLGFKKRDVGQRIEFGRMFRSVLRGPVLQGLELVAKRRTEQERFALIAGMIKVHRDQPAAA